MLQIGPFELHSVVTGTFRLDGGAMFGVVPKTLWSNTCEFDEENRIYLATRTLLAIDRTNDRIVICDTGCGTKWAADKAARFAIHHDPEAITKALAAQGFRDEEVTDVVVTHLHFDHNGGLTDWYDEPGGPTQLRYPGARHWIHERQWAHANHPHVKDRASYLPEDFAVLADHELLTIVSGDRPPPPFEGLEWFLSHGHTPYHLHPLFRSAGQALLLMGDLAPTVSHMRPAWVMAYDLLPMTTIDEKLVIFRNGIEEGWLLAFAHDPKLACVQIDGTPERPIVSKTVTL